MFCHTHSKTKVSGTEELAFAKKPCMQIATLSRSPTFATDEKLSD